MSELIGNDRIKKILRNIDAFQTIVIEGPEGSGKGIVKDIIIKTLLCQSSDDKPCDKCNQCIKYNKNMHMDVKNLDSTAQIDKFREELERVQIFPCEGKKKVYIIPDAQKLTSKHQNILLKLLEEPPEFVVFILLCDAKEGLLRTVLSRATVLTMSAIPDDMILEYLKKKYPKREETELKNCVRECGGYIGVALESVGKKPSDLSKRYYSFLEAIVNKDEETLFKLISFDNKKRDDFNTFVDRLLRGFKDILAYSVRTDFKRDFSETEKPLLSFDTKRLIRICEALQKIKKNLELNVNINIWGTYLVKECME